MSTLIGLCGRSGSGKDEVARILSASGYTRMAIADHLKDVARLAFGLTKDQLWGTGRNEVDPRYGVTPRVLYQRLGDGLRGVHPAALLRPFLEQLDRVLAEGGRVVIPDVRLREELKAVRERGGVVWRVVRPVDRAFDGKTHPTETALDDAAVDATLRNDGSLEELASAVEALVVATRRYA